VTVGERHDKLGGLFEGWVGGFFGRAAKEFIRDAVSRPRRIS